MKRMGMGDWMIEKELYRSGNFITLPFQEKTRIRGKRIDDLIGLGLDLAIQAERNV